MFSIRSYVWATVFHGTNKFIERICIWCGCDTMRYDAMRICSFRIRSMVVRFSIKNSDIAPLAKSGRFYTSIFFKSWHLNCMRWCIGERFVCVSNCRTSLNIQKSVCHRSFFQINESMEGEGGIILWIVPFEFWQHTWISDEKLISNVRPPSSHKRIYKIHYISSEKRM